MPNEKRAFDLTRMTAGISSKLSKAVRKFHAVMSVELDLRSVRASLVAIREQLLSPSAPPYASALLAHAVVVYARASHSTPLDRYQVGVTKAFSKERKAAHDEVIRMRDKVIAHFGTGDGWHDERVVLLQQSAGLAFTHVHRRTNNDSLLVDRMLDLVDTALPHLAALRDARLAELSDEILQGGEALIERAAEHPFDPASFYKGMQNAAERFWDPLSFEESSFETLSELHRDASA